jgi:hypothetical protein
VLCIYHSVSAVVQLFVTCSLILAEALGFTNLWRVTRAIDAIAAQAPRSSNGTRPKICGEGMLASKYSNTDCVLINSVMNTMAVKHRRFSLLRTGPSLPKGAAIVTTARTIASLCFFVSCLASAATTPGPKVVFIGDTGAGHHSLSPIQTGSTKGLTSSTIQEAATSVNRTQPRMPRKPGSRRIWCHSTQASFTLWSIGLTRLVCLGEL